MRFVTPYILCLALLQAGTAFAQENNAPAAEGAGAKTDKKDGISEEDLPTAVDEPAVVKEFTRAEINRICARYRGELIAYYGDVFRVDNCERRPLTNNKTIYTLLRSGKKIIDVDGDVVAALPEGEPVDIAMTLQSARGCRDLEGRYVTYSNVDVYFVEHCKKRVFPDWETYIKHREKRGEKKGEILSLSWIEFETLQAGEPINSVIDDIFAKLLTGEAGVDVIPLDEACHGLEGKVVSYYSRLYRVERCRKREIVEPEMFLRHEGRTVLKIKELNSEQWLSLPEGQPVAEKPAKKG